NFNASISGTNPEGNTDFQVTGNNCGTVQAAPATCSVAVTFTPSQAAGVLETATLSISSSATGGDSIVVSLTGALGAIKVFDPLNAANSNPQAGFNPPFVFASATLSLSCSTGPAPTGTVSSTPDGTGNVLVDNFINLAVTSGDFSSSANICQGGAAD